MGNSGMRCPTVRAISGLQEGDFVSITVVKRSGQREPYDANKINLAIVGSSIAKQPSLGQPLQRPRASAQLVLREDLLQHFASDCRDRKSVV